jgi:hypothetical protein
MIRQNDDLVIPVHNAFWPAFFTSMISSRMIGQCVALSVINRTLKQQILFLYPEYGFSSLPELRELLELFPYNTEADARRYHDPDKLPVAISDLRDIAGVHIDSIVLPDRTVFLLTPLWQRDEDTDEILKIADSTLTSVFLPAAEFDSLDLCSANHLVLHAERDKQCKVIALVRNNSRVRFTDKAEFFSSPDGLVEPFTPQPQPKVND